MTKQFPPINPLTVYFGYYHPEAVSRNHACFLCGVDHELRGYVAVEEDDNLECVDLVPLCEACHGKADRHAVLRKLRTLEMYYGDRYDDDTLAH